MLAWLSVWGKVQICIWCSWCHCHSLSLAPVNPDWFHLHGFTFLVPAHPGCPRQNPESRKLVVLVVVVIVVVVMVVVVVYNTWPFFTALWTLSRTTRVNWYQKVHFAIFWIFWCKMKITQADAPTIRMDCHPIRTNWCPHLCHPHHPSWHNPPNLS